MTNQDAINLSDQLFSHIFLEQRRFNALKAAPPGSPAPARPSGRGHGPFCEFSDGAVKYDLSGAQLLGHGHPITIKSALASAAKSSLFGEGDELAANLLAQVQHDGLTHCHLCASPEEARQLAMSDKKAVVAWELLSAGRTPCLFAFQHQGKSVDRVAFGGGLPVCGVLSAAPLRAKQAALPWAVLYAANKTLTWLCQGNFHGEHGRIQQIGSRFAAGFARRGLAKANLLQAVGCMVEFQVDTDTKEFVAGLFDRGIVCAPAEQDRVRFLPPLSLKDEHIDEIFAIVEAQLNV